MSSETILTANCKNVSFAYWLSLLQLMCEKYGEDYPAPANSAEFYTKGLSPKDALIVSLGSKEAKEAVEIIDACHQEEEDEESETDTRTYKITGDSEYLDVFEKFLGWMVHCGVEGHCGTAAITVDGDGDGRFVIEGIKPTNDFTAEEFSQLFEEEGEFASVECETSFEMVR